MSEPQNDPKHLKDMVVRGAFLVVLIYLLVYIYNSGLLNKTGGRPTETPKSTQAPPAKNVPIVETEPESTESFQNYYENNDQ